MDDLTPEQLEMLLATLGDSAEQDTLSSEMDAANKLRNYQPDPTIQAGNMVIPNYAGALAGIFQRGKGEDQYNTARDAQKELYGRQAEASRGFLEALNPASRLPPNPAATFMADKLRRFGINENTMLQDPNFDPESLQAPQIGTGGY